MWICIGIASALVLLILSIIAILKNWYRYAAFAGEQHIYLGLGRKCKSCKCIHEVRYPGYRRIYAPAHGIVWETDLFGNVYNARTIIFPPPTEDVNKEVEYCLAICNDIVWNTTRLPETVVINRGPIVLEKGVIKFSKPDFCQLREVVRGC